VSRLSIQDVREARQASRHLPSNERGDTAMTDLSPDVDVFDSWPVIPGSDQEERAAVFFAAIENPAVLDAFPDAA
jgi:hypothetical protein